jgi:ankyrin repeat protein
VCAQGSTALHYAAFRNEQTAVERLIEKGADVNANSMVRAPSCRRTPAAV